MIQRTMAKKTLSLLATCQGLMLSCMSLTMATSPLVGVVLAPDPAFATLPLGILYVFIMLTMVPASLMMKRFGRRAGFMVGGLAGMTSGILSAISIYISSFGLFCVGAMFFGICNGFGQYYRFAAAEIVDDSYKSRAISWVLAGGLIAAFIGPNTARLTREMIPDALFAASYASIAVFCIGIVIAQLVIRLPKPSVAETDGEKRPLGFVLTRPVFLVAVLCAMIAYGTMNLLMTATPLAMNHRGMDFSTTAMVIQWHIVGMFAPSFFTGSLIHRFGVLKIMFIGALALLGCAVIAQIGEDVVHFFAGLLLLGIGWNFFYVGGTTLLTEVYLPAEKGVIQGINEFLVFSATAFTAMTSGYFHYTLGWESLNRHTLPVVIFATVIILLLGMKKNREVAAV